MPSEHETYEQFPQINSGFSPIQNQTAPVYQNQMLLNYYPGFPNPIYPHPLENNQSSAEKIFNQPKTQDETDIRYHTVNGGQPYPEYLTNVNAATYATSVHTSSQDSVTAPFNYDYIGSPARIAIYDSLKAAPRVVQIDGGPTHEYIERIASLTFKYAKEAGGHIPYTVIREVSENFIHANFREIIVSILDAGDTIRFADQGPGISQKELAQEPGFSSATEPMKRYIRGVGSGLPIVKDYLDTTHGYIQIEDNINHGSVVTISLVHPISPEESEDFTVPSLTNNETAVVKALYPNETLGITEVNKITGIAVASIHTAFSKMEEAGLVEKVGKKRTLTERGRHVVNELQSR